MIHYSREENKTSGKLFGRSGGQLEYVSQRIEHRLKDGGRYEMVMVMRFTDHDHASGDNVNEDGMIDSKYYDIEFPIYV